MFNENPMTLSSLTSSAVFDVDGKHYVTHCKKLTNPLFTFPSQSMESFAATETKIIHNINNPGIDWSFAFLLRQPRQVNVLEEITEFLKCTWFNRIHWQGDEIE